MTKTSAISIVICLIGLLSFQESIGRAIIIPLPKNHPTYVTPSQTTSPNVHITAQWTSSNNVQTTFQGAQNVQPWTQSNDTSQQLKKFSQDTQQELASFSKL